MRILTNRIRVTVFLTALCLYGHVAEAGIIWTGSVDGNWDTTTANWSGDSTTFTDDGTVDVTFNNAAGGTITISPNMSPTSTTVSASSGTYIFSGGPIDAGSMTKSGAGTLQLTSANTFPGGFTLNAGKVECAHLTDVFGPGTITLNGGELSGIVNASASYTNAVVIGGGFKKGHNAGLTLDGPVTLNGSYTITNLRNSISFNGVITDGGNGYGITFDSPRTDAKTYLGGLNTFSGKVVVKASRVAGLIKNEGEACGFGASTGTNAVIDLYNGVVLGIYSGTSSDRVIDLVEDGAGTVEVSTDVNGGGTIGSFATTGTGPKTLRLLDTGFFGSNPGWMIVSGEIPDVSDGSKLSLEVPFTSSHVNNALTLSGTNTFSGPITIGGTRTGKFRIGGSGSLGAGTYTNTISIGNGCTFDYASSATQELSGAVSGGGTLEASGTGVVSLTAPSNSVGGVVLSSGGTLQVGPRIGDAILAVTNNIDIANGQTGTLSLDITGGEVLVNVAGSLVYGGTHTSYLKIIGGGQETPIISYGGTVTNFDYVVYNDATNTWAEAQVPGALSGYGGKTQLRIAGNDIYIDPLPPRGTILVIR